MGGYGMLFTKLIQVEFLRLLPVKVALLRNSVLCLM